MNFVFLAIVVFLSQSFMPIMVNAQEGIQVQIPAVENWEAAPYPFGKADMGHPTRTVVKWHKDPRGKRYEGATVYYKDSHGKLILFSKSWNIKKDWSVAGGYDWRKVRTALLQEDGVWFVGKEGEMLEIHRQFNDKMEVIAVEYKFYETRDVKRAIKFKDE